MIIGNNKLEMLALSSLKKGESGKIVHLSPKEEKDMLKFLILGLIPGEKVTVIHKIPLYVIQVGHAQIALDLERAMSIYVLVE